MAFRFPFPGMGIPMGGMGGMEGMFAPRLPPPPSEEEVAELYGRLGLEPGVEGSAVKRAYLKMARKLHPDRGGDAREFQKVQEAYDILGSDDKRKVFLRCGYEGLEAGLEAGDVDPAERRKREAKPPDLQLQLRCSLAELLKPQAVEVPVRRAVIEGDSKRTEEETVTLDIPAGAPDGYPIRLMERGHVVNGVAGDLVVQLDVQRHPRFKRRGPDLILQERVTLREVLAGFILRVPLPEGGALRVGIPPGRGLGDAVVVPHRGLPTDPTGDPERRGAILISLSVGVPRKEEGVRISDALAQAAWDELPDDDSSHPRYNPALFADSSTSFVAPYEGLSAEDAEARVKVWARNCGQDRLEEESQRGAGGGGQQVVQCAQQ